MLSESVEAREQLDLVILGCFTSQKLYGRDPDSIGAVTQVFQAVLAPYPVDKVSRAFELWMRRNQEFPTPADIVSLIERNGKPPLSKETYISLNRKDPERRTPEEWAYLREYEDAQMRADHGWDDRDANGEQATFRQVIQLRKKVMEQDAEIRRLNNLLRFRTYEPLPKCGLQHQIDETVKLMRADGHPEENIQAFLKEYGQ